MKEVYCSFEVAKLLKELRFPQNADYCHYKIDRNGGYHKSFDYRCGFGEYDIIAPTHQRACAWLRKKYNIVIEIAPNVHSVEGHIVNYVFGIWYGDNFEGSIENYEDDEDSEYDGYEKAMEAALKHVLYELKEKET